MPIGTSILLRCKPGTVEDAMKIIAEIAGPTRDEEGCLLFEVHRSAEDDDVIYLYEQYVDEAAVDAHFATPMGERIKQELFPLLADRQYDAYEKVAV